MASSNLAHALNTAGSWLLMSAFAIGGILYFNELNSLVRAPTIIDVPASPGDTVASSRDADGTLHTPRSGAVELKADRMGHFSTTASVNGSDIEVMVDTGASIVALTYEDAERAGIYVRPADYTHVAQTANGHTRIAPVTIDTITIGDITVRGVRGAVSEPGKLGQTLLGMAFLGRLSRAEMRRGTLILED